MARTSLLSLLHGGDRRSIGSANQVAELVLAEPKRVSELLQCMWNDDAVVRMRAADASEKLSRRRPELLKPFKAELLGLADESDQKELRWHLAQMIPRLNLSSIERRRAITRLKEYLNDRSSIVKTFALQGLTELVVDDQKLQSEVTEVIEQASRSGTPAMRARARKLLSQRRK